MANRRRTIQRDPLGRVQSEYEEENEENEDAILRDGQSLRVPLYLKDGSVNPNLLPHQQAKAAAQQQTQDAAARRFGLSDAAAAPQVRISLLHRCRSHRAHPAGLQRLRCCRRECLEGPFRRQSREPRLRQVVLRFTAPATGCSNSRCQTSCVPRLRRGNAKCLARPQMTC
jgi:hypothetical protein